MVARLRTGGSPLVSETPAEVAQEASSYGLWCLSSQMESLDSFLSCAINPCRWTCGSVESGADDSAASRWDDEWFKESNAV